MPLIVRGAVVCDDIRREDTGKELLIGVYSAELNVTAFPANLRLFFWLMAQADEAGEYSFALRLMGPNNVQLALGEAGIGLSKAGDASAPLGPIPIQVQSAGHIALEIRLPGEDWKEVKRLPVTEKAAAA